MWSYWEVLALSIFWPLSSFSLERIKIHKTNNRNIHEFVWVWRHLSGKLFIYRQFLYCTPWGKRILGCSTSSGHWKKHHITAVLLSYIIGPTPLDFPPPVLPTSCKISGRDKQASPLDNRAEPSREAQRQRSRSACERLVSGRHGSAAKARAVTGDNSWRRANKSRCWVRRSDHFHYCSSISFCFFPPSACHFPQKR